MMRGLIGVALVFWAVGCGSDSGNGSDAEASGGTEASAGSGGTQATGGAASGGSGVGGSLSSGGAGVAGSGVGGSTPGVGGTGAGGTSAGELPETELGCDGEVLFVVPEDPGAKGPWPVGVQTATVGGLTTEIWYPAVIGSDAGQPAERYDIREFLPGAEAAKVSDEKNPLLECDCSRDLPLDSERGPYPVIVFLHGTGAFRQQSLSQASHWASRGFIVLSQDHPGLYLTDALSFMLGADQPGNTQALLNALSAPSGDLAFLAGHLNLNRVGMSGHSAGGGALSGFNSTPGVRVLIPMAAGGAPAGGSSLESTLVMGAVNDTVAMYGSQVSGFEQAAPRKRLVGLANAGHLAFSNLCSMLNPEGQDLLEIAVEVGISNANLFNFLWDGCDDGQLPPERGIEIVNFATTAAFEETLRCSDTAAAQLAAIQSTFAEVSEYREEL